MVFVSENPYEFGEYKGINGDGIKPVTVLSAHAGEILTENGTDYITTCGWYNRNIPNEGCVSIARLDWK